MICQECKKAEAIYPNVKLCRKCYLKQYYQKNKDKWKKNNPEKVKAKNKRYREKHKEKIALYRVEHKEKHRKYMDKYHQENQSAEKKYRKYNQEKIKSNVDKWRKTVKGISCMRRHKLQNRNGLKAKSTDIEKLITNNERQYGDLCCEKCGKSIKNDFHIDHIIPVSKGGDNSYNNLQLLCPRCNREKRTAIADYRQDFQYSIY